MQAQTASSAGPGAIRAFMQERGFTPADGARDIHALGELAANLIGAPTASAGVLASVQRRTGHSLFLKWERGSAVAFLACFPLTQAGEQAIRSGSFDGLCIAPEWIAPFSASTRAGYIWGLGGAGRAASFAVMRALRIMRERFFSRIDLYARAATPAGRRLMEGFGYLPLASGDSSVLRAPAMDAATMARAS